MRRGLQLSLTEVVGFGPGVVVLFVAVVLGGISTTLFVGRRLGPTWEQRLLIACGFSIGGAAAAAAVEGAIDAGGIIGGGALGMAPVVVKLGGVLMLA